MIDTGRAPLDLLLGKYHHNKESHVCEICPSVAFPSYPQEHSPVGPCGIADPFLFNLFVHQFLSNVFFSRKRHDRYPVQEHMKMPGTRQVPGSFKVFVVSNFSSSSSITVNSRRAGSSVSETELSSCSDSSTCSNLDQSGKNDAAQGSARRACRRPPYGFNY